MNEKAWLRSDALFDVAHSLVEDLPDKPTEPVCNGPDGRFVPEARQQSPEDRLEGGAFATGRGVSGLIKYPPHVLVAFSRAAGSVLLGTFFFAWTGANPGSELRSG